MYTEEYEAKGFPLRKFLLRFIFVVIFICLLIWLIPKFTSPKVSNQNQKTDLSPIHNRVFMDNLSKLQEVGIDYYTKQRLPKRTGEASTLTLNDMIQKKLIVPLVDQDDKACDIKKSYVKVTKMDQEYLMKVNLKCSKEEDYILLHLGDYSYCDSAVCPKKETEIQEEKTTPKKEVSFGKNSSTNTKKSTDSVVAIVEDVPDPVEISDPVIDQPVLVSGYQYEYKKVEGAKYSDWTNWSNWQHTNCNTTAYGCNDQDPNCLKKVQVFKRKEQVGTYDKEYVASRGEIRYTNSYNQLACSNYEYISYNKQLYVTTGAYSMIDQVTNATRSDANGWRYDGRKSFASSPSDSLVTRYKYVGADFSSCSGTCTTAPKKIYDVYTYTGTIGAVSSATTSGTITTLAKQNFSVNCNGTSKKTIPIYASVTTYEKQVRKEALYGTVCYASEKSRTLISAGTSDVRFSNYNDRNLLNKGYYYTGNTKKKG